MGQAGPALQTPNASVVAERVCIKVRKVDERMMTHRGCRLSNCGTWPSDLGNSSFLRIRARLLPRSQPVPCFGSHGHDFTLQGCVAACWFLCWLSRPLAFGWLELTAFEPVASLALPASAGGRLAREPASRPGLAAVFVSIGLHSPELPLRRKIRMSRHQFQQEGFVVANVGEYELPLGSVSRQSQHYHQCPLCEVSQ